MPHSPQYLKLGQAAERYQLDPRTIRRRIDDGVIDGYRLAGSRTIRVRTSDLEALFERMPTTGGVA